MATNVMKHSELRPLQTQLSFPENTTEQPGIRSHLNDMKLSPVQIQESRFGDPSISHAFTRPVKTQNQVRPMGISPNLSSHAHAPASIIPHRVESMPRLRRRASTPGFLGIFYKQRAHFRPDETNFEMGIDEAESRNHATYGEDLRKVHSTNDHWPGRSNYKQARRSPPQGHILNNKGFPDKSEVNVSASFRSRLQQTDSPHKSILQDSLEFSGVSHCTVKQATVLISKPFESTITQIEKNDKKKKDLVPIELFPAGTQKALIGAIESLNTKGTPSKNAEQQAAAIEHVPKIAIMHSSQRILLYPFTGPDERLPEQILTLQPKSAIFPCEREHHSGWPVRVLQDGDDNQRLNLTPRSQIIDFPSAVSEMTFLFETESEMTNWLNVVREQIRLASATEPRPKSQLAPDASGSKAVEPNVMGRNGGTSENDRVLPQEIVFTLRRTSQETRLSDDADNDGRSLKSRYSIVPLQPDIVRKRAAEVVPPVHPTTFATVAVCAPNSLGISKIPDPISILKDDRLANEDLQGFESTLLSSATTTSVSPLQKSSVRRNRNFEITEDGVFDNSRSQQLLTSPLTSQDNGLAIVDSDLLQLKRTNSSSTKIVYPRLSHLRAMSETSNPNVRPRELLEARRIGLPSSVARTFEPARRGPQDQCLNSKTLLLTHSPTRSPGKETPDLGIPQTPPSGSSHQQTPNIDDQILEHLPASVFVPAIDSPRVEKSTYFPIQEKGAASMFAPHRSNAAISGTPPAAQSFKDATMPPRDLGLRRPVHLRTYSGSVFGPASCDFSENGHRQWPVPSKHSNVQNPRQPTISERRRNGLQSPNLHLGLTHRVPVQALERRGAPATGIDGTSHKPAHSEGEIAFNQRLEGDSQVLAVQTDTTALPKMSTDFIPTFSPATISSPIMPTYPYQPSANLCFVGLAGDLGSSMGIAASQPPLTPLKWSGSGGIKDRMSGIFRK